MSFASADLEIVTYQVEPIAHATDSFVNNFSKYSGIAGTEDWPRLWFEVMSLIKNHEGFVCQWSARGVDIDMSFFDDPRPGLRDGNLVYATPEPQIAFYEKPNAVSPGFRTYVNRAILAIALEMHDVYHLRLETNPFRIVFPNDEYAKSVQRYTVPILG